VNSWLQACDSARQTIKSVASTLLDQQCYELFFICDSLKDLWEEAEEKDCCTVVCGLCAANYRLAGTAKIIANAAMQALTAVDGLSVYGLGIKQTLMDHQSAINDFVMVLQNDCRNDLMHLTSELAVILEHQFVLGDDSLRSRLQSLHDTLEDRVESLYEMGDQLEKHSIMGIDTTNIGILKVIHSAGA